MSDLNKRMSATSPSASDPGVAGVVITGSAQTFSPSGRGILVEAAGTVTGKLVEDAADLAYTLTAGLHGLAFKSITSVAGGFVGKIIL